MTRQSAFTIVTPVRSGHAEELAHHLGEIGDHIDDNPHLVLGDLDRLHYASFVIFCQDTPAPFLLFEGNVDGVARSFVEEMVTRKGGDLDAIYRHCVGYPEPGSKDPAAVVSYLMNGDLGADTFYIGWRGRSVTDIRREQQLREHLGHLLDQQQASGRLEGLAPDAIRERLQDLVRQDDSFSWASTVPPAPFLVRHGDQVLHAIEVIAGLALALAVRDATGGSNHRRTRRARAGMLLVGALLGSVAGTLRRSERTDDARDDARDPNWETEYSQWSRNLTELIQRENVQGQNHMASIVRVKEGRFRLATLSLVLWAINLLAVITFNKGRLGPIASIHFARWVKTADQRHLVFLSNFDGSWESYLNDFIDLASGGLTAVWTNTDNEVGFPSTSWLVRQGARDEARFKGFARRSQARTLAWYSAYPDLSIPNIANNKSIREQLYGPLADAQAWLRRI